MVYIQRETRPGRRGREQPAAQNPTGLKADTSSDTLLFVLPG